MATRIRSITNTSLGAPGVQAFKSTQQEIIKDMRDAINTNLPTSTSVVADTITPKTSGAGTASQFPIVSGSGATVTLTASQSGSTILFDRAAGIVYTLPAATVANKGVNFTFVVTTTITSNNAEVDAASASDLFLAGSSITQMKGTATPTLAYYSPNGSSNYKLQLNGSTKGGIIGDIITFTCLGLNSWLVNGTTTATGTVATPFAG